MSRTRHLSIAAAGLAAVLLTAMGPAALADPLRGAEPLDDPLRQTGVVTGDLHGLAGPPTVAADSWVVADADTGEILAAKRAKIPHPPASTLKVLTALAVVHQLPPDEPVIAPAGINAVDGTRVGLVPGHEYSVSDLMTALLIASGNDAAEALAAAAGGRAHTLAAMRSEAVRLQALDTVPGTPSGLDSPGQHTTAYDLALFGRAAIDDPEVAKYLTVPKAIVHSAGTKSFQISNHNPLLGVYPGSIGVKAGYTTQAEATYIGAAKRNGHRIIVTLMFAYPRFKPAATALLDWGFAATGKVEPIARLAQPLGPRAVSPEKHASLSSAAALNAKASPASAASQRAGATRRMLDIIAAFALILAVLRMRVKLLQRRRRYPRSRLTLPRH